MPLDVHRTFNVSVICHLSFHDGVHFTPPFSQQPQYILLVFRCAAALLPCLFLFLSSLSDVPWWYEPPATMLGANWIRSSSSHCLTCCLAPLRPNPPLPCEFSYSLVPAGLIRPLHSRLLYLFLFRNRPTELSDPNLSRCKNFWILRSRFAVCSGPACTAVVALLVLSRVMVHAMQHGSRFYCLQSVVGTLAHVFAHVHTPHAFSNAAPVQS